MLEKTTTTTNNACPFVNIRNHYPYDECRIGVRGELMGWRWNMYYNSRFFVPNIYHTQNQNQHQFSV